MGVKRTRKVEHVGALITGWVPVFIGLGLFAQIAFLGLRPSLAERAALDRKQAALERMHAERLDRLGELEDWVRAQEDPIYQERVRLMALDPER